MTSHRRGADPGGEPDQRKRGRASKHGGRLLKVALLGGAVALLVNEDLRNQLLDALFGAEEEFHYSSVTEPPLPGRAPGASAEPEPVSSWADTPNDDDAADRPATDELAESRWASTRVAPAVAPSPEAWAASPSEPPPLDAPSSVDASERADAPESADPSESAQAPDPAAGAARPQSPALPRDWWSQKETAPERDEETAD